MTWSIGHPRLNPVVGECYPPQCLHSNQKTNKNSYCRTIPQTGRNTKEKGKGEMKLVAFVAFIVFLFLKQFSLVHSQNSDSCKNKVVNFNGIVNFDTTYMVCHPVWKSRGYILRYAVAGPDLWSFLLSAPNIYSWVGIGFSVNGQMIGSSAMVGWVFKNGTGIIRQYYLKDTNPSHVQPNQGELNVVENSTIAFMHSKRIYLAFQLSTVQPRTKVLYAVGPIGQRPNASEGYTLAKHRDQISTLLDYDKGISQAQNRPYTGLRRTHGAFNMIGWGILMPIGTMAARYLRKWDPIWFYSHTAIQILSFLFGLVGFILGFNLEGSTNAKVEQHKNLGITVFLLGCLQVMALLIRPRKGAKLRKYWNWYHHLAGRIMVILAISNVFYGIRLGMEGLNWSVTYGVVVAILFIASIYFEIKLQSQR